MATCEAIQRVASLHRVQDPTLWRVAHAFCRHRRGNINGRQVQPLPAVDGGRGQAVGLHDLGNRRPGAPGKLSQRVAALDDVGAPLSGGLARPHGLDVYRHHRPGRRGLCRGGRDGGCCGDLGLCRANLPCGLSRAGSRGGRRGGGSRHPCRRLCARGHGDGLQSRRGMERRFFRAFLKGQHGAAHDRAQEDGQDAQPDGDLPGQIRSRSLISRGPGWAAHVQPAFVLYSLRRVVFPEPLPDIWSSP
jgi:hypothetical protein